MLIQRCVCGCEAGEIEEHNGIRVLRCACGIARLVCDLSESDYEGQYADGSYHQSSNRHAGCVPYADRYANDYKAAEIRTKRYRSLLNGQWRDGMLSLDVGAANGAFVDHLQGLGMRAVGIDPYPVRPGHWVVAGSLKNPPESFDSGFELVTYHDVLEHMIDPLSELNRARSIMASGGTLIVDVPDVSVPAGAHHWKSEHLWYWTADTLRGLMSASSFNPITIDYPIPGKLVAYGSAV